jgi:SAM-dependent methyltransferase
MEGDVDPDKIREYFDEKLRSYGATPLGVDWNSSASQEIRFEQLVKIIEPEQEFSLVDYGCGYGALADFLQRRGYHFHYTGYDLLESMVASARKRFPDQSNFTFTNHEPDLRPASYGIASGIFNKKFEVTDEAWTRYTLKVLDRLDRLSLKGFAFNMLTQYSDPEYMEPDLYYADPGFLFHHCKTHFSPNVALLHDYKLYDFTILVRKPS